MPNYRIVVLSVVAFVVMLYFFILPWITSTLMAFKIFINTYYLRMLYAVKVIESVLIGTTILYLVQTGHKHIDLGPVRRRLQFSWYGRPRSTSTKETKKEDEEVKTIYPLQKVYLIASEMLSTEEQYVNVLRIIETTFHVRVENENLFPPDIIQQMFANIRTIYQFHKEVLFPSLRERMKLWKEQKENIAFKDEVDNISSNQTIGDIFAEKAPFLTQYTTYIKNFDNAMNTIDKHRKQNKKFSVIMDEIEASPNLQRLSLQHHMIAPVQRIPRYKLLLQDYIKKLPENSSDLDNAQKALDLVEKAASHSNETIKRIEQVNKILEVQQSLGNIITITSPTREFIKEGDVSKISITDSDTLKEQDRYMFLFNDLLLLCRWSSLARRVSGGAKFKLKAAIEFEKLVVTESLEDDGDGKPLLVCYSNSPDSTKIELMTRTTAEKDEWVQALSKALKSFNKLKSLTETNGLQDQETCRLEETKSNPQFVLHGKEYDNDSDNNVPMYLKNLCTYVPVYLCDSDNKSYDTPADDMIKQEEDNLENDMSGALSNGLK